jgi:hypothetical protein
MTAWDGTDKTPVAVAAWVRARTEDATGDSIFIGIDSNGTEDDTECALQTAYEYHHHVAETNPDGAVAWDAAAVNADAWKIGSSGLAV